MTQTNTQRSTRGGALILGLLLAALLAAGLMLVADGRADAAVTFTVNSTGDPGTGGCNSTECTLREAIAVANRVSGADTIRFNIAGSGVKTIRPASKLPTITEAVTVDGYTQPGSSPNTLSQGTNSVLKVRLDGTNSGGLEIQANNVVVRGLVINDSRGSGVSVRSGTGSRIEGNFLGTDATGTLDRGNFAFGAQVDGGSNNTIGGTSPFQRNLISGNDGFGVELSSNGTGDNVVRGNLIGTQKDGTSPLGNSGSGVYVDTTDNTIGGTGLGEANVIAFNDGDGVFVEDVGVDNNGNRISANAIFANGGLGIDLRGGTETGAGATANDTKDPDTGANDLQNKPVLTAATNSGGKTTISGKLNSTASDPFVIELYSNPAGNEGRKFLGNKAVSTNSNGNVTFSFVPSQAVPAGQTITATATNVVEANTSEFSAPRTVVAQ
jgi:CSLREA domain-containing protein